MSKLDELAELIFPNVTGTIEDLEKRFPKRDLPEGAEVTRFAPSPTGFLHTGSLFTAMIANKIAKQSQGVFYIRLEDTDTKREIEGSGLSLINQLNYFGVIPNEGYLGDHEEGNYGPYTQSKRSDIYDIVIKQLIREGKAYPCFCTAEELDEIRSAQESAKLIPGYYGIYARCRNLDVDDYINRIKNGDKYIIRFRSNGDHMNKIKVHDEIRGNFLIAENDMDIVIRKSDGLPTYHFAHIVDDHFMRTTLVSRGEEWISSLPIHLELFSALGWEAPKYAHLPVIMKLDNGNKRKLSKRKDKEAATDYFLEKGYPKEAVLVYLMSIANSNFEEWTLSNKSYNLDEFNFQVKKMGFDGALYDLDKLNYFSKEIIARLPATELVARVKTWAKDNDKALYERILDNEEYFTKIINIERDKPNPRKDYAVYGDIYPLTRFFYKEYYEMIGNHDAFKETLNKDLIKEILEDVRDNINLDVDEQTWFGQIKEIALKHGFAANGKDYKANPEAYKGTVGDVAEILRITLTTSKNSPNLYNVMTILGKEEVTKRINYVLDNAL